MEREPAAAPAAASESTGVGATGPGSAPDPATIEDRQLKYLKLVTNASTDVGPTVAPAATMEPAVVEGPELSSQFTPADACWPAFRIIDRDGDGRISSQELQLMFGSFVPGTEADANPLQGLRRQVDEHGDGIIGVQEFVQILVNASLAKAAA